MLSEIKRWGNSAAVRLPSKILAQANLSVSSVIRIEAKDGTILIAGAEENLHKVRLPFSEADLVNGLNENTAHADELTPLLNGEWGDE